MIAPPQGECDPLPGRVPLPVIFPRRYTPFVWQVGSRLVLMDRNEQGWVVAELVFHDRFGHYEERRRVAYESPREAAGVLLAALAAADDTTRGLLADALDDWLGAFRTIA